MTRRSDDIDQTFGRRLRTIREARGLSQTALAQALGVTFQQVQKYESGMNAVASTRIPALCAALKTAPGELFAGMLNGMKPEPIPELDAWASKMALTLTRLKPAARAAVTEVVRACGGRVP